MKIIKYIILIFILALSVTGCYTKKIENACFELKIGMTKDELDNHFVRFKFLKEQTVVLYSNSTEDTMRRTLQQRYYEDLYPGDIFNKITFDGNIKVYSYLIKRELNWPNGWIVNYLAVFYNKKDEKVIGWAKISTYGDAKTWRETF